MSHTIMTAVLSPFATVGMVFVIMWGMNAAGSRRNKEEGQDNCEQIHSGNICHEKLVLIDSAEGGPVVDKRRVVGEKPCDDRSINHGICILTQLDVSNRQRVSQLVSDLVLKELARLNGRGTNISC